MLPQQSPRQAALNAKRMEEKRSQHKKRSIARRDTPQIQVNLKLFSPTKAERWDPRNASSGPCPNYTLIMADQNDIDEAIREDHPPDSDGVYPDWETYVDSYSAFEWLEGIEGWVTFQQNSRSSSTKIGFCRAQLIRREWIADTFWDDMEGPEHEMAELAFDLFDHFGCLKSNYKDHIVNRGSGVWNDELNKGDILLIEEIEISPGYRRQGIGSMLARAILNLASRKSKAFFGITWPGIFERVARRNASQTRSQLESAAVSFWRSLGFRRIGSSRWLGYSPDQDHPSRSLAPEQDFDLPPFHRTPSTPEIDCLIKSIPTSNDAECLRQLNDIFSNVPSHDARWEATDEAGNTLLHLVLCSFKAQSAQWLMQKHSCLPSRRNVDGHTPLEVLEASMERRRSVNEYGWDRRADISDQFTGFDNATISCLVLLRGLAPEQLSEDTLLQLRHGCTCGRCIGGFLSPRMRDILQYTAETTFDFIYTDGDDEDGEAWCEENEDTFEYLPEHIKRRFATNKSVRIGFCMLWKHFASCLESNLAPTGDNVLHMVRNASEWPPHCRNFIQAGGTISSVGAMLFKKAMQSEQIWRIYKANATTQLPRCRNDREFGFASGICGYERATRVQLMMFGKRIRL
ncbi:hypothetical protein MGYG_08853 [Nannizzia gypsea CBS 118893]|uniref:N-acetyltransferase domain-containing protein n=1 Tax=Arthroderma gypseum (strain ATCC MYA-4604 / CBS 118893) TaxID=535722 RepID=E4V762_ARTGP|nr:hypothetical protein MGYG_08853 [Nannizzia gypsea CBS 118893]EFQ96928.1 hypothetical protein MGYG_08853 [Nannizzia gypsea CBS 118893]